MTQGKLIFQMETEAKRARMLTSFWEMAFQILQRFGWIEEEMYTETRNSLKTTTKVKLEGLKDLIEDCPLEMQSNLELFYQTMINKFEKLP